MKKEKAEEAEEESEEEPGGTDPKARTPHNYMGKKEAKQKFISIQMLHARAHRGFDFFFGLARAACHLTCSAKIRRIAPRAPKSRL